MCRDSIFLQFYPPCSSSFPANAADYTSIEVKETPFCIDGVFIPPDIADTIYFCSNPTNYSTKSAFTSTTTAIFSLIGRQLSSIHSETSSNGGRFFGES
jgi:Protein of unknown function (DUF2887)